MKWGITQGVLIKIEVNMVGRGLLGETSKALLCFAALDRQHPRDLFDVKLLFDNEGLWRTIKKKFDYFGGVQHGLHVAV